MVNIGGDIWPGNVIPYTIDQSIKDRPHILEIANAAIQEFNKEVGAFLKFKVHGTCYAGSGGYVVFKFSNHDDNDSEVGCKHRRQEINLASWCKKYDVLHEMVHTAGFLHEHQRKDRDKNFRKKFRKRVTQTKGFKKKEFDFTNAEYKENVLKKEGKAIFEFDWKSITIYLEIHKLSKTDRKGIRERYGVSKERRVNRIKWADQKLKKT